jgi:hypothetical protein
MAFKNRIRLPFYLTRPQYPRESNIFRRADGSTKVQSSIIRKVFEGETENLPKEIHERLVVALSHDDVIIEGKYLATGVSLEGDYDIDWNKFLDFPLAKAAFKVQVTPFNFSNDNCQTCEEAAQISLDDDTFPSLLEEGQTYNLNVFANDSICCSPITAEIVIFDSNYITSANISAINGIVTITMKATISSATNVNLLTYRVSCPNGGYDEANVFGDTDGTEPPPTCATPTNLLVSSITETSATVTWDNMAGALTYFWQLYLASDLITPISSGYHLTNNLSLSSLTQGTNYAIYVQTNCTNGSSSGFTNMPFTTEGEDQGGCGQYNIENWDLTSVHSVNYIDCNGVSQDAFITPGGSREICALEYSPGDPIQITPSHFDINITYLGPC